MLKAMLRALLAALGACVLSAGCAASLVQFPNATPGAPRPIPGWLSVPRGRGPFPAVVLLHGCHGVSASTHEWAMWFKDRGYVALVVDSWAARGMSEGCSLESPDLPNTERFDDAVGALRFLHELPYVDRDRVGVIGWSNGGVFAMSLVNGRSHERGRKRGVTLPEPGVRAAVAVYPGGCPSLVKELAVRPLLVLVGGADDWAIPGRCVAMAEAMRARGADVLLVLHHGAGLRIGAEDRPRMVLSKDVYGRQHGDVCAGPRLYGS